MPDVMISTLPHDLSPWGMFMAADWVVKAVMIGLALASLITWTVWLAKSLEIAAVKRRTARALERIVAAGSLEEAGRVLEGTGGATALLARAACHEMAASADTLAHGGAAGIKERVASHLSRIEAQAARRMTRGTGVLATIGSTAPFVGLFGTVWGIYHALLAIGDAGAAGLQEVAGPVGEALIMTGIGLAVAIPASMAYNAFARARRNLRIGLDAFAHDLLARLDEDALQSRASHGGAGGRVRASPSHAAPSAHLEASGAH